MTSIHKESSAPLSLIVNVAGVLLFAVACRCAPALGSCPQDPHQDGGGQAFPRTRREGRGGWPQARLEALCPSHRVFAARQVPSSIPTFLITR